MEQKIRQRAKGTKPRKPKTGNHKGSPREEDPSKPAANKDGRVERETAHTAGSEIYCSENGQVKGTCR